MYSIYVASSACSANCYIRELRWAQLTTKISTREKEYIYIMYFFECMYHGYPSAVHMHGMQTSIGLVCMYVDIRMWIFDIIWLKLGTLEVGEADVLISNNNALY